MPGNENQNEDEVTTPDERLVTALTQPVLAKDRAIIVIESPVTGGFPVGQFSDQDHADYLQECLKDSLGRGESPVAAELLYGPIFDVLVEEELVMQNESVRAFAHSHCVAFYVDHGWTADMLAAKTYYAQQNPPIPFVERWIDQAAAAADFIET